MEINSFNTLFTYKKYNNNQKMFKQDCLNFKGSSSSIISNNFDSFTPSIKEAAESTVSNRPFNILARCADLEKLFPSKKYPSLKLQELNLQNIKDKSQYLNIYLSKLQTEIQPGETIEKAIMNALEELKSDKAREVIKMWLGLGDYEPLTMIKIQEKFGFSDTYTADLKNKSINALKLIINDEKGLYEHFAEHLSNVKTLLPGLIPEPLKPEDQTNEILRNVVKSKKTEIDNALDVIAKEDDGERKSKLICMLLGLNPEEKFYRQIEAGKPLCKDRSEFLSLFNKAKTSLHREMNLNPQKTTNMTYFTKASKLSILFPEEMHGKVRDTRTIKQYLEVLEIPSAGVPIKRKFKKAIDNFSDSDLDKVRGIFDGKLSNNEIKKTWQQCLILTFGLSGELKTSNAVQKLLNLTDGQFETLLNKGLDVARQKLKRDRNIIEPLKQLPLIAQEKPVEKMPVVKNPVSKEKKVTKLDIKLEKNNEPKEKKKDFAKQIYNEPVSKRETSFRLKNDANLRYYVDNAKYLLPETDLNNISSPQDLADIISAKKEEIRCALKCFNTLEDGDLMKCIIKLLLGIDCTKFHTRDDAFRFLKEKVAKEPNGKNSLTFYKFNKLYPKAKEIFHNEMCNELPLA